MLNKIPACEKSKHNFRHALLSYTIGRCCYSDDRLKAQESDWNSGPYTLKEIRKNGGICVAQAYYASGPGQHH